MDYKIKANEYSPLVLAYIGDAVYEVYVRDMLIKNGNVPLNKLNQMAKNYVKASSQANIIKNIMHTLNEKEVNIFKRGRNTKTNSSPKNASLIDYKYATGFEALIGYLYVDKQIDRLEEIISEAFSYED